MEQELVNETLLQVSLLLAYGPFVLMLVVFLVGLFLKWSGNPAFLKWLVKSTEAQEPLPRKSTDHGH